MAAARALQEDLGKRLARRVGAVADWKTHAEQALVEPDHVAQIAAAHRLELGAR